MARSCIPPKEDPLRMRRYDPNPPCWPTAKPAAGEGHIALVDLATCWPWPRWSAICCQRHLQPAQGTGLCRCGHALPVFWFRCRGLAPARPGLFLLELGVAMVLFEAARASRCAGSVTTPWCWCKAWLKSALTYARACFTACGGWACPRPRRPAGLIAMAASPGGAEPRD